MVLCGRFFCMGQTLVNGGFGASDADDGGVEPDYEGKVRDGETVYEFEIDALTGNFDEWEVDDN